jgi:DNA primase
MPAAAHEAPPLAFRAQMEFAGVHDTAGDAGIIPRASPKRELMTAVDDIKARLDIVELVSESVRLRRTGKNYIGFCPFHPNVHTPAFVVFPESGTWRCFGACNEGGDLFKFVMKKEGWDFPEALRQLATRAGIELHPRSADEQRAEETYEHLRGLLELAATYYRNYLLTSTAGATVRDYLHGRGLADETLEAFQVGLAPAGREHGLSYFRGKGYTDDDLQQAGVVVTPEGGGLRDRFHNRITIPIRDNRGRMCGFGARIVDPNDVPKFLNSPQSPIFDKGHLLYGLDRAARAIRAQEEAVIVEGYLDVMTAHQAGFLNVVSPMGTALTEAQLRMLKRHARRIVLALDADSAGDAAALRGLDLARETLEREGEPVFDARGLVRFEGRLQADLRVATLPAGLDPDELILQDREAWRQRIAEARPVVEHVLGVITQGRNLNEAKVKAEVAARILPLIEDVADPVERDAYRQQLARLLRVELASLQAAPGRRPARRSTMRGGRGEAPSAPAAPAAGMAAKASSREAFCLGALVRQPLLLFRANRIFGELGLARPGPEDLTTSESQWLLEIIQRSLSQEETDPAIFIETHAAQEAPEALAAARASLERFQAGEEADADDVLGGLLRLRQQALERKLGELRFYILEKEAQSEESGVPAAAAEPGEAPLERMKAISENILRITIALARGLPALPTTRPASREGGLEAF